MSVHVFTCFFGHPISCRRDRPGPDLATVRKMVFRRCGLVADVDPMGALQSSLGVKSGFACTAGDAR